MTLLELAANFFQPRSATISLLWKEMPVNLLVFSLVLRDFKIGEASRISLSTK